MQAKLDATRKLLENWDRIADVHGVGQFTGNTHRLFANELRVILTADGDNNGETK